MNGHSVLVDSNRGQGKEKGCKNYFGFILKINISKKFQTLHTQNCITKNVHNVLVSLSYCVDKSHGAFKKQTYRYICAHNKPIVFPFMKQNEVYLTGKNLTKSYI